MFSRKVRHFRTHTALTLEDLVPPANFYRQLEAKLDLSFVRDLVRAHYADGVGRPAIDPVVFFKLQLIMFFEGIRSERQLMETVNLHLAHRWYLGYDLDEPVPDHSSLSKIRTRYGLEVFQRFFEQIVQRCIDAGLVWGKELYFDGTKVQANASIDRLVPRFYAQAKQHLQALCSAKDEPERSDTQRYASRTFIDKYDGTRLSRREDSYERTTDSQVSLSDPDAAPMKVHPGASAKLGYHTHYVVDGGKARIILAAFVSPASIMDNTPMLDLARWVRFRWQLRPTIAVGDGRFGTIPNIVGLEQDGLRAYVPMHDRRRGRGFYPAERFRYDAERDIYHCPQGQVLRFRTHRKTEQVIAYRADPAVCNTCPVKAACTQSRTGRSSFRSYFQDYVDRVRGYWDTAAYKKAMGKRKVWVEPLFGEGKQWHGMSRFRLRHLWKVNIEGLVRAAGQNIKRLLKHSGWKPRLTPAGGAAFALSVGSYLTRTDRDRLAHNLRRTFSTACTVR